MILTWPWLTLRPGCCDPAPPAPPKPWRLMICGWLLWRGTRGELTGDSTSLSGNTNKTRARSSHSHGITSRCLYMCVNHQQLWQISGDVQQPFWMWLWHSGKTALHTWCTHTELRHMTNFAGASGRTMNRVLMQSWQLVTLYTAIHADSGRCCWKAYSWLQ